MYTTQQQEDLHISYIMALCAGAGISYDIQSHDDDSTDGIMKKRIYLPGGNFYDVILRIQLKSTYSTSQYTDNGDAITYRLKVKNYNYLCTRSSTPIILGLLILPEDKDTWLTWSTEELLIRGRMYWADFSECEKSDNQVSVTVTIDKNNVINQETLVAMMVKMAEEA
jgi:hypothetical protein